MDVSSRSLVLAVDAVGAKHSGAATVLTAITAAALACSDIARLVVFASPRHTWRFALPDHAKLTIEERPLEEKSPLARIFWFEYGLPRAVQRHGANVLLTLSAGGRPPRGVAAVAFLQQSAPFVRQSLCDQGVGNALRLMVLRHTIGRSAKASNLVVVQTAAFGDTVRSAFGLERTRIRVITPSAPNLPQAPESPPARLRALVDTPKGQRLLYVGSNAPYKNTEVAIRGIRKLNELGVRATLFLTFDRGPLDAIDGSVVYLGSLSRQELAAAYEEADILVMPSLTESLGLPLLEGMSVGLPILAVDRPYAREVTAGQAEYFDPCDPDSFVRHCRAVLENRELTQSRVIQARHRIAEVKAQKPYDELIRTVIGTAP